MSDQALPGLYTMEKYVYQPLSTKKSVRLMTLLPLINGEALQCTLEQVEFDHSLDFEAISYVWGDIKNLIPIVCDGKELRVTENLIAALQRFRFQEQPRRLWADTICVNQEDLIERSEQVKLMGTIYENASCVLVWLGEEDEPSQSACSYLQHANELGPAAKSQPPTNIEFQAMKALFQRPWFSRAWTYQECFLAGHTKFHCGSMCLQDSDIRGGITALLQFKTSYVLAQTLVMLYMIKDGGKAGAQSLSTMLNFRRGVGATDPRDLLYALREISTDGDIIEPDYQKPFEEVFSSAARQCINSEGSLRLLEANRTTLDCSTLPTTTNLPTWVPDWREVKAPDGTQVPRFHRKYLATGTSKAFSRPPQNAGTLHLRGIHIDSIKYAFKSDEIHKTRHLVISRLNDCADTGLSQTHVFTEQELQAAFNELVFGCFSWKGYLEDSSNEPTEILTGEDPTPVEVYKNGLQNRKLFLSDLGRFGLAHEFAREGDVICLLLGGDVPVLLRPVGGEYEFVGECYVNGLMHGEGFVEARRRAEPDSNHNNDVSWLQRLHEEPLPFETKEFALI